MKLYISLLILSLASLKGYTQSTTYLNEILQQHNYTIGQKYPPLSLFLKGKAVSILGKKIQQLEQQGLDIRTLDPNGQHSNHFPYIYDYLSSDDTFRISLGETQGINPSISYHVITKNNEVFGISANWLIDYEVTSSTTTQLTKNITTHLFPILKGKLKLEDQWEYIADNKVFTEL
jgi:hypothetical protein